MKLKVIHRISPYRSKNTYRRAVPVMKLFKHRKGFTELKFDNKWLVISNVTLTVLLGASLIGNVTSDQIVINKGNPLCEQLEIASNSMNEANHIKNSTMVAENLGNITPKNAEYRRNVVLSYANSNIYQKVADIVGRQIANIQEEKVSISFTAESAKYEDGKTFITGKLVESGASNNPITTIRTYEFQWSVRNYNPSFTYINVYDEAPHDRKWREKHEQEK